MSPSIDGITRIINVILWPKLAFELCWEYSGILTKLTYSVLTASGTILLLFVPVTVAAAMIDVYYLLFVAAVCISYTVLGIIFFITSFFQLLGADVWHAD